MEHNMQQRTKEWYDIRRGKITASGVCDLMRKGRTKEEYFGKTAMAYIKERFASGLVEEEPNITSQATDWGIENEQYAKAKYAAHYSESWGSKHAKLEEVGFISKEHYGCSPDGLIVDYVGSDERMVVGCVEIKCPFDSSLHVETILENNIPEQWKEKYYAQMQMQMFMTGTQWCDYVSFDPRMRDPKLRVHVIRVNRDNDFIADLVERLERAKKIMDQWTKQLNPQEM